MVLVLLQPGLCLLLGPASNANASPWQAGAESPSIIKEDSSLRAEKMKATEWDREKSVGQTCGNSGGVREHPRRKWGGKRGESGWGREVRGRSHPHACRQTKRFSFCSTRQSCLSRGWPSSTLLCLRLITPGLSSHLCSKTRVTWHAWK